MHGVRRELLARQAKVLGLPLVESERPRGAMDRSVGRQCLDWPLTLGRKHLERMLRAYTTITTSIARTGGRSSNTRPSPNRGPSASRSCRSPPPEFEALDRERVTYVVVGGFARVVHGSAETTDGLDIVPSLREENLRRLGRAIDELQAAGPDGERVAAESLSASDVVKAHTRAGELRIVAEPWGTRGYDDLRIRASRENLGRGARPSIASVVDCVRMLDASDRPEDIERLFRMRRMLEIDRQLTRQRGLRVER